MAPWVHGAEGPATLHGWIAGGRERSAQTTKMRRQTNDLDTSPEELNALTQSHYGLQLYHWLIIIASLGLTLSAWYITAQQEEQKRLSQFDYQARHIVELVRERMLKYEDTLWSGVAALHASDNRMDSVQWRRFSETLSIESKYPGINGIGIIYHVTPEALPGFLAQQRRLRPDFGIHPTHGETDFWPITYIEPVAINRKAVGLDMAHETNRYTASRKTRDTGTAQITAPIILVQDARQTPGFLFFVPYYKTIEIPSTEAARRADFIGLVYAPFIAEKLMNGVLENENRLVNFSIRDGEQVLYDELTPASTDFDPHALLTSQIDVDLYGRRWTFDVHTSTLFREQYTSNQPMIILVGGLIIDVLLVYLFYTLTNANKRAVHHAREATRDLRRSMAHTEHMARTLEQQNAALQHSNQELDRFAHVASHDLKAPLNAIQKLCTWIEEDCGERLPDESRQHFEILKARVRRLAKLLDDLLLYSRAGRGAAEPERIELAALVEDVVRLMDVPERFSVHVHGGTVTAPRQPLEQVLRNLIGNVVKHHGGTTGRIDITLATSATGFDLTVSDDGVGIPEALRERALRMFETLKPRDETEGSGIGLALCKKIVESCGGSFSIATAPSGGAAFISHWPLPQPAAAIEDAPKDEAHERP